MGYVKVNPIFEERTVRDEVKRALCASRCLRVTLQRGFAYMARKAKVMAEKRQIEVTQASWNRIVFLKEMDPWDDLKYEGQRSFVIRIPERGGITAYGFSRAFSKYLSNIEAVDAIDVDIDVEDDETK